MGTARRRRNLPPPPSRRRAPVSRRFAVVQGERGSAGGLDEALEALHIVRSTPLIVRSTPLFARRIVAWKRVAGVRYAEGVIRPVLRCCGCGQETQLPFRPFLESSAVEPYWPDSDRLAWVCDACGQYRCATQQEIEWRAAESLPALPYAWGFWRVEIACRMPGCDSRVVAHTQTFGMTSRSNLGQMIAKATPHPVCGRGHIVCAADSYPARIDYVEYVGPEQYVS